MNIRVSIIGATGYVGAELVRLLYDHPQAQIKHLISSSHIDESFSSLYNNALPISLPTMEAFDPHALAEDTDVFFTSLPHGASQDAIADLHETGKYIIDMSGDFRYDDPQCYQEWYGVEHQKKDLLAQSVYGMPELHRSDISATHLIGNPGCYTTTSILALAPLIKHNLVELDSIVIDAKSGTTGAGRKASMGTHFCEVNENLKAYNVAKHRHTSEIEQELSKLAKEPVLVSFTPHLLPINRGILATSYAKLAHNVSHKDIMNVYQEMYANEPFVQLYEEGSLPEIKHVRGSNMIGIGFVIDPRTNRIVVVSCLDNLIKGAAGQAIQNMNILFGIEETTGLSRIAWYL